MLLFEGQKCAEKNWERVELLFCSDSKTAETGSRINNKSLANCVETKLCWALIALMKGPTRNQWIQFPSMVKETSTIAWFTTSIQNMMYWSSWGKTLTLKPLAKRGCRMPDEPGVKLYHDRSYISRQSPQQTSVLPLNALLIWSMMEGCKR